MKDSVIPFTAGCWAFFTELAGGTNNKSCERISNERNDNNNNDRYNKIDKSIK